MTTQSFAEHSLFNDDEGLIPNNLPSDSQTPPKVNYPLERSPFPSYLIERPYKHKSVALTTRLSYATVGSCAEWVN